MRHLRIVLIVALCVTAGVAVAVGGPRNAAVGEATATPSPSPSPTPTPTGTPDIVPPDTTINEGPGATTLDHTPTFRFSSNDPAAGFQCSLDGDPWTACSSPLTTRRLGKGSHTFDVRAVDRSGNIDPTPAKSDFQIKRRKHR
jgi:hypothetical protein